MTTTIRVSRTGALTLPEPCLRSLGLGQGGVVTVEETPDGVLLRPATVLPLEMYTDERVREFDQADAELGEYLAARDRA